MGNWFTIDSIGEDTFMISEYRHWEETHAYLLNGSERSLLIDTGLGIENIYEEVSWLSGGFPLPVEQVRKSVAERCDLPEGFSVETY